MRVREFVTRLIACILLVGFISGCSDHPDRQATKKIRNKTNQALDKLAGHISEQKLTDAKGTLQEAIGQRASGEAHGAALLASGNLKIMQAREGLVNLELTAMPVTEQIRQIQEYSRRLSRIQLQRERIETLLAQGDQEIEELGQILDRNDERNPGLRAQLAAHQTQLSELTKQQAQWQQKADAADEQLQALQSRADEALRQARLAGGSQKEQLEKTGYDLLLQKKSYYLDKQEAVDQVGLFQSRIDLIRPLAESLRQDIAQTEQKIAQLRQSEHRQQLRSLRQELQAEENRETQNVLQQINELKQYAGAFRMASEALIADVEQILGHWEQIRSRDAQPVVAYKSAQSRALIGSILASRLYFEADLGLALEGLTQTADASIQSALQEALGVVAEDELLKRAVEQFDQADEAFESAQSFSSQLKGNDQKSFEADVTKSRLLVLDEKMRLADRLDRYELAEASQTKMDQLRKEADEKFGAAFAASETAELLDKGLAYTPRAPFDSTLFFESIKPQIVAWKSKIGPEREQTALQTLQYITQLEARGDETLIQLLEPEKRAIETARDQGFPEEAAAPPSSMGFGEPNGF